ncbi:30S ribosomal protein S3 [candidate division WOR-1 bacterium RIFOXYB2_FULL_42_35]|uniref:Small ribosomal subunit protein uS3 n=1 Tax=candidate division WOR-1 bacterium RIFOXYC2_FULL_41_25 TaxID=1802586 RepID=A0A1F4TLY9_UNCSA|nr:MAG: 30S ribosomal protein S3 [candidate division WOR-1 bacterium RIFOXYA2_FULL_41_14]OGC23860.1 MAG: 30S ribosomal protein S3 [candidate division WOR-1 bacterium RIFOXYB2_FULL_42_35]OGC33735.1 MAG: 30S ribosomal protein S3 [candidate division WOR-1 bacterium RIFOXYC2_FULL_41_25]
MGQKCHPKGLRIGIIENWESFWYADRGEYAKMLAEDLDLRKYLKDSLFRAGISRIFIGRKANQISVDLHTAKPGLIIGKGGKEINAIREKLMKRTGKQIQMNVHEESRPESCAILVAEYVASQLERRISYRRAMKQAVSKALRSGGKGVKIMCAGRLGGSEIARCEWYRNGRVPLQTLRAKIDYGFTEAMTLYGKIGVKVWIYKGDVLKEKAKANVENQGSIESTGVSDAKESLVNNPTNDNAEHGLGINKEKEAA